MYYHVVLKSSLSSRDSKERLSKVEQFHKPEKQPLTLSYRLECCIFIFKEINKHARYLLQQQMQSHVKPPVSTMRARVSTVT